MPKINNHSADESREAFDSGGTILGASKISTGMTRRRDDEEALRRSEAALRTALEAGEMGAWEWDILNNRVTWTERLYDFHGIAPGSFKGTVEAFTELVHPDDLARVEHAIQNALSQDVPYRLEFRVVRPGGEIRWLVTGGRVLRNAKAEPERMVGVTQDVTDRKRAEEREHQLTEERQTALTKLRAHFNYSPLAAIEWTETWKVVQWSQGAERLFGIPRSEAIGRLLNELPIVHLEDMPRVSQTMRRLVSGKAPFVLARSRNLNQDGRVLHCEWYNTVVSRTEGGVSVLSLVLDVTDRTLAEEALRESEANFRQLADSMPQLVWTALPDATVDYYNQQIHAYRGASRDAAGNWSWNEMVHPDDRAITVQEWEQATSQGRTYAVTHRIRMADGQVRWHLSRALPVRDSAGNIVKWFGTATDIDDQKRSEEKLEAIVAQRTAKLRETVADLEAFSYSIAHDMRAPLRSMSGYASILRAEYARNIDAEGRNFLERIEASAGRLDRLIQDVLNYSKIVRGEMDLEAVDFGELTREIILSYPHLQEPHASIELQQPLPVVLANPAALTQVISNLLGNAVKFVKPGTKPQVVVRSEPGEAGFVRFWFEDNGIGIDSHGQARIFQIFQRLNRAEQYDGTGIGLSIVRKAAERMGGRVGLQSEIGRGSRFWVELREAAV